MFCFLCDFREYAPQLDLTLGTQWVCHPVSQTTIPQLTWSMVFSPSSPFSPDTFLYAGHSSVSSAPVEDSWALNYESLVGWLVWVWELAPQKKQKNELEAIVLQFFLCLLFGMFLLKLLTFPEAALFSLTLNLVHSLINQFMYPFVCHRSVFLGTRHFLCGWSWNFLTRWKPTWKAIDAKNEPHHRMVNYQLTLGWCFEE